MTSVVASQLDAEQGLIQLPGEPAQWIWAFTCSQPECACRTAIVLSAPGARETLAERGRVVADAWVSHGEYGQAAQELEGVTAFAIDLDTREVYPPLGDRPLDVAGHPALREVIGRMDDDVLDAIARNWYRAKGKEPPTEAGGDGAKIEVEGWHPGDLVIWDDARPSLRSDTYVFGDRVFEVFELYCVDPDCHCCDVIVDFTPVMPRGAPHPGHVEFDGKEATLHPDHERHRERLAQLWSAYCERHPRYAERFGNRSAVMHGLGGRIIGKASLPRVGRNELCPCGSGKKYKKCCGAAS